MNNPVISGYHADPFVYRDGEDYYMVCTTETVGWEGAAFHMFHSTDLQNWSEPAEILDLKKDVAWADKMAWAPALIKKDGYWYFVFCGEQQIGIAVCDTPMGHYRDVLGKPLLGRDTLGTQTIDPSLFADTDGKTYLIWQMLDHGDLPLSHGCTSCGGAEVPFQRFLLAADERAAGLRPHGVL